MRVVPREDFVPDHLRDHAYDDVALPIAHDQTISQPFIVASMLSALQLRPTDRVLEVGTGSGYQAAVIAQLTAEVITVERIGLLAREATQRFTSLGYVNVRVFVSGDELGWPELAPYDAIIVAAAAPRIPQELINQMGNRGRLVVPVGDESAQELMKISKHAGGVSVSTFGACQFVPLIGKGAWPEENTET